MTEATLSWWSFLCGVSTVNMLAWLASALLLRRRLGGSPWLRTRSPLYWHLVLSAGYVFGCAYRSWFPVFDVQRLVMVDSWLSSVAVGRSVATVAELCFAAQWALFLQTEAHVCRNPWAARVARAIVPMIVVAECCSWHAVLTTSNLGHVLEESLWGASAALLVASFVMLLPRSRRLHRWLLATASILGLAYVLYMFRVDVPMYWQRWLQDEALGRHYFSIVQGLDDVSVRWVVSRRWSDWQTEVVWMSLYFSVAVWLSIGLAHAARWSGGRRLTK